MQRKTVLLLFGGESSEHDVSIMSARNIASAIDKQKYEIFYGYIDRQGKWWLREGVDDSSADDLPQLIPLMGSGSFVANGASKTIQPDVIFPALHGKNGEDGSVAGLGALLHIPVVGCDMTAGALCMDKVATKEILAKNDIEIVPYHTYRNGEKLPEYQELFEKLGDTLFVKPSRAGSSVGVSKVESDDELTKAIDEALKHDSTVLIERAVVGRELETAALGNPPEHEISGVGEVVQGDNFYTYDEKYSDDSTSNVVIPADLDEATVGKIRSEARKVYQVLGCRGLSRIDFFLSDDGKLYVNEVNTLPGFTNISMYPKLWQQAGIGYAELIDRLIELAE